MKVRQILIGVALVYGFTFVGGFIVGVVASTGGIPAPLAIVGVMISNLILSVLAFCIAGVLIKTERFKSLLVVAVICWLLSALNMSFIPEFTVIQWAFSLVFILVTMGAGGGLSFLFAPAAPKSNPPAA
ncbi:MAG TPA: hypothetical protein VNO50_01355 [Pyrinomonadaceae bacterium]|nr:hypothetical protein [Pyrinomonadaceae bacterium]